MTISLFYFDGRLGLCTKASAIASRAQHTFEVRRCSYSGSEFRMNIAANSGVGSPILPNQRM